MSQIVLSVSAVIGAMAILYPGGIVFDHYIAAHYVVYSALWIVSSAPTTGILGLAYHFALLAIAFDNDSTALICLQSVTNLLVHQRVRRTYTLIKLVQLTLLMMMARGGPYAWGLCMFLTSSDIMCTLRVAGKMK